MEMNLKSQTSGRRLRRGILMVVLALLTGYVVVQRLYFDGPKANVLVIVLDCVRADRLGCYGNSLGLTPNIDAFSSSAVRFVNAFSHSSWTLPSVASLYTSRYPFQHGAGGRINEFTMLPDQALTVSEVFRRQGARTGAVVNVAFLTKTFGMQQGFEVMDASPETSNDLMRRADSTTDAALKWLDGRGRSRFFLLVHYFDAHLLYDPPVEYRKRFADPLDKESKDCLFGTRQEMIALRNGTVKIEEPLVRRLERLYNGEVAFIDAELGRLLRGLSERGLDKDTIVAITSDHGEEFFEHGSLDHGHSLYDELLRVPLLMRVPEARSAPFNKFNGRSVDATVRHIDVAPTLCRLAGIDAPKSFTGEDLGGVLDQSPVVDRPVISQGNMWGPSGTAWRNKGLKLIRLASPEKSLLFNLRQDPLELKDVAEVEAAQRKEMEKDLESELLQFSSTAALGQSPNLSEADKERLKSLGYMK